MRFQAISINYTCSNKTYTNLNKYSRGRGAYRGRGRGNYYRQDRNSMHQQHHLHQSGGVQQNPNMPYYDQSSMNLMNTGMASGQGGYNDGVYHDTQPNRYDWNYIPSKNFIIKPFKLSKAFYTVYSISFIWV